MTAPVLNPVRPARQNPSPAAPASRPQLRVLRSAAAEAKDREAEQRRLVRQVAVVATVVAALCLFGVVVFHVVLTQNQFRLDALRAQASERQAEYDRLRLQVAELESPNRVVAEAQQRLGMVTPPKITYLTPSVDEPGAGTVDASRGRNGPGAAPGTDWSTVKPHLAEG